MNTFVQFQQSPHTNTHGSHENCMKPDHMWHSDTGWHTTHHTTRHTAVLHRRPSELCADPWLQLTTSQRQLHTQHTAPTHRGQIGTNVDRIGTIWDKFGKIWVTERKCTANYYLKWQDVVYVVSICPHFCPICNACQQANSGFNHTNIYCSFQK